MKNRQKYANRLRQTHAHATIAFFFVLSHLKLSFRLIVVICSFFFCHLQKEVFFFVLHSYFLSLSSFLFWHWLRLSFNKHCDLLIPRKEIAEKKIRRPIVSSHNRLPSFDCAILFSITVMHLLVCFKFSS